MREEQFLPGTGLNPGSWNIIDTKGNVHNVVLQFPTSWKTVLKQLPKDSVIHRFERVQ